MNERDKLAEKARELAADRQAKREAEQRQNYEYEQKLSQASYSMRQRLEKLKRDYEGTVRLSYAYSPSYIRSSFSVEISGGSTAWRKASASIKIDVGSSGFYVTDETKQPERYQIPFSMDKTEEEVVEILRGVAAEFLLKQHSVRFEFPEWYTVLITILAGVAGVACWVLVALFAGLWGLLLGWIGMVVVFKVLQHVGPVLTLIAAVLAVLWAVVEALTLAGAF